MYRIYLFIQTIRHLVKNYTNAKGSIYAAYAAFFTFLALIPLLMFILGLIHILPITKENLVYLTSQFLPETFQPMFASIVNELYNKSSTTLLSVAALTTLWSASKGVYGIILGINSIYYVPVKRNYIVNHLIAVVYTFLIVLSLLMTLIFMVFGTTLQEIVISYLPFLAYFDVLITFLRSFITICVLALIFMIIYTVFPYQRQTFTQQAPGALIASIGWIIFSFAFSIYVEQFSNYSYMYGSLTTIILLLLWLNICINILFIGGAINHWLDEILM
ncbi:MAG: YihY/virulence factor BrkB family protein [Lachnospiraceae bacterium]